MNVPYFDLHCDTISEGYTQGKLLHKNNLHLDLERLTSVYTPIAQVFALWGCKSLEHPTDVLLYEHYLNMMQYMETQFLENQDVLQHCRTYTELLMAEKRNKIGALVSVESADLLACDIKNLEQAYMAGVRIVHLCWNFDNVLTGSCAGNVQGGLTVAGRKFVAAAQEMGMLLDLSHISDAGFWDVIRMTKAPVFASHSNARSIWNHPRNLTDDMFRAICATDGVVGINLCPDFVGGDRDIWAILTHVMHLIALGGAKHICLGGDLDGVAELPENMSGVQDVNKIFIALQEKLSKIDVCKDIFRNNAMSFFERVL